MKKNYITPRTRLIEAMMPMPIATSVMTEDGNLKSNEKEGGMAKGNNGMRTRSSNPWRTAGTFGYDPKWGRK